MARKNVNLLFPSNVVFFRYILKSNDSFFYVTVTFLKDFKKASTKIEKLVDNVLIKNVSVKQCARICLRDQAPDCASFDYCPSDKICRITGYDEAGSGQAAQLNCSHFTRK